jgi:hypothetical protein
MNWGVYEDECSLCHKRLVIVATVHSVGEGYTEWHAGPRLCPQCAGDDE